jgi:hypothetical protein
MPSSPAAHLPQCDTEARKEQACLWSSTLATMFVTRSRSSGTAIRARHRTLSPTDRRTARTRARRAVRVPRRQAPAAEDHARRADRIRPGLRPGRLGSPRASELIGSARHAARNREHRARVASARAREPQPAPACAADRGSARHRRPRRRSRARTRRPTSAASRRTPGLAGRRARPRAALVPFLCPHVPADLLRADVAAHELPAWHAPVGGRLAGAGERGGLDWPSAPGRCASAAWPCTTSLAARWRSSP